MASHFLYMFLYALVVSIVFSLLMKTEKKQRIKFGLILFLCFIGFALVLSWIMYPFPS
jgi:ABC-type transport system involved in cytochrome c biogenesis permease component